MSQQCDKSVPFCAAEAAVREFDQGRPLAGVGAFWDYFEEVHGRAPTWDELESTICDALTTEARITKSAPVPSLAAHDELKVLVQRFENALTQAVLADAAPYVSDVRLKKVWDKAEVHRAKLLSFAPPSPQAPQDVVPLGTISQCPSCEGEATVEMTFPTPGAKVPCWRCSGSGRVMAYRETPEQFAARKEKREAFVAAVNAPPSHTEPKYEPHLPCKPHGIVNCIDCHLARLEAREARMSARGEK